MTYEEARDTLDEVQDLTKISPSAGIWYGLIDRDASNELQITTLLALMKSNPEVTLEALYDSGVFFLDDED